MRAEYLEFCQVQDNRSWAQFALEKVIWEGETGGVSHQAAGRDPGWHRLLAPQGGRGKGVGLGS